MIKKILCTLLCLTFISCGGFTKVAGLKFNKLGNSHPNYGNAGFTDDAIKLDNREKFIGFMRPMGECGGGVSFFGILLPIIPVGFTLNSCEENFFITTEGHEILNLKIKYGNTTHDYISLEKITHDGYRKKYKFKIDDFDKFKITDDKAIIVIGKVDRKEFTKELPVKWGVMSYYTWSFP